MYLYTIGFCFYLCAHVKVDQERRGHFVGKSGMNSAALNGTYFTKKIRPLASVMRSQGCSISNTIEVIRTRSV